MIKKSLFSCLLSVCVRKKKKSSSKHGLDAVLNKAEMKHRASVQTGRKSIRTHSENVGTLSKTCEREEQKWEGGRHLMCCVITGFLLFYLRDSARVCLWNNTLGWYLQTCCEIRWHHCKIMQKNLFNIITLQDGQLYYSMTRCLN